MIYYLLQDNFIIIFLWVSMAGIKGDREETVKNKTKKNKLNVDSAVHS